MSTFLGAQRDRHDAIREDLQAMLEDFPCVGTPEEPVNCILTHLKNGEDAAEEFAARSRAILNRMQSEYPVFSTWFEYRALRELL